MKNAIFIAGMLLSSFVIRAGDISKYVLDNYLIPVGQSGSVVGRIYPTPSNVRLLSDTSSLFRIDLKEKSICLKKNKALSAGQTSYRYGITLLIDGQQCEFVRTEWWRIGVPGDKKGCCKILFVLFRMR